MMRALSLAVALGGLAPAAGPIDEGTFADPPPRHGPAAFWFWMDDLAPDRIVAQIETMAAGGVGGFCIHPRVGLSREVGYLTDAWFARVRLAVETARRLGLEVWLYDEGMYPSGSANGMVCEGHPAYRCSALAYRERKVRGPRAGLEVARDVRGPDEIWIATWAVREGGGRWLDLSPLARDGKPWDVPEGRWRVVTFFRAYLNTKIRGMGFGPSPLAADLLGPAAMERFIRLTHARYARVCGDAFGGTVKGIFTDEPSLHGRGTGGYRNIRPWTDGFAEIFRRQAGYDLLAKLPALWFDFGPDTAPIRWDYETVLARRFDENYYGRLSRWCEEHGIALTGHPAGFGELGHERYFHVPGQDIVWRQVTPEKPRSVLGKVSSSAEHIYGRSRNLNEVYGAYGWALTPAEMKWLCDWLCVRGVNLHMLHAFYSSLEGDRKHERPPDVGFGNLWWPHFRLYADYLRRVVYATTRGDPVIRIAVFDHRNRSAEKVAYWLLQIQRDFDYLEERVLREEARLEDGEVRIHACRYRVLILDNVGRIALESLRAIEAFRSAGGHVIAYGGLPSVAGRARRDEAVRGLAARMASSPGVHLLDGEGETARARLAAILDAILPPDIRCDPPAPDLRYLERAAPGQRIFFLTNESIRDPIRTEISFLAPGVPAWWDPSTGRIAFAAVYRREGDRCRLPVEIEPYEGRLLVFREGGEGPHLVATNLRRVRRAAGRFEGRLDAPADRARGVLPDGRTIEASAPAVPAPIALDRGWRIREGDRRLDALGSWTRFEDLRHFSGTRTYEIQVEVPRHLAAPSIGLDLDLGDVRAFARLEVNGRDLGVRLWPPFRWDGTCAIRPGPNRIAVRVTNTLENRYDGKASPSGLLGPVVLRPWARVALGPGDGER